MLRPNTATIVGKLYNNSPSDRDSGFSYYYMGISIGSFLAPLFIGTIGQTINYHFEFSLSTFFMGVGLIIFTIIFSRKFTQPNYKIVPNPISKEEKNKFKIILAFSMVAIIIFIIISYLMNILNLTLIKHIVTIVVVGILVYYFTFLLTSRKVTYDERKKVIGFIPLFIALVLFAMLFESGGTVIADLVTHANNHIGSFTIIEAWYQSINPLSVAIISGVFAFVWYKMGNRNLKITTKVII
jgi:POT family proton-dependent oligopeptide transporter